MKVLAVDDDLVARMALHGMVTSLGHECLLARDGEEGWQLLQQAEFDVVITDRVMPDMDGLELCRRIRAQAGTSNDYLYVILASALGEEAEARDGMLAGADDYLVKPLRLRQLELKLIAAERVSSLHRRLTRATDELRLTTERDAETNQRLTEVNQLQADMMAMLSHDARQPLAAVIGYVEATRDDWDEAPDKIKLQHLNRAASAARRLDQLIEDVLTMGNLDAGTISSRARPVTVAETVAEAITATGGPEVDVQGDLAAVALVDPWHLRQVLTNLIANAIKYGRPPVRVTIADHSGPADSGTDDQVTIEICDSGEGVPAEFVPRLFDRFSRAETGIAAQKQGTGFGLYIVHRLIEVNGGQVSYRPGEPAGACFTVTLPAAARAAALSGAAGRATS
jgi:signal transduction histidine kinase